MNKKVLLMGAVMACLSAAALLAQENDRPVANDRNNENIRGMGFNRMRDDGFRQNISEQTIKGEVVLVSDSTQGRFIELKTDEVGEIIKLAIPLNVRKQLNLTNGDRLTVTGFVANFNNDNFMRVTSLTRGNDNYFITGGNFRNFCGNGFTKGNGQPSNAN
jgi:hypothetical protein